MPAHLHPPLATRDFLALGIFTSSFLIEVIADYQKSKWRKEKAEKKHEEQFISRGLWGVSRHPK